MAAKFHSIACKTKFHSTACNTKFHSTACKTKFRSTACYSALKEDSPCDNVVLELETALNMKVRKRVKFIMKNRQNLY